MKVVEFSTGRALRVNESFCSWKDVPKYGHINVSTYQSVHRQDLLKTARVRPPVWQGGLNHVGAGLQSRGVRCVCTRKGTVCECHSWKSVN